MVLEREMHYGIKTLMVFKEYNECLRYRIICVNRGVKVCVMSMYLEKRKLGKNYKRPGFARTKSYRNNKIF